MPTQSTYLRPGYHSLAGVAIFQQNAPVAERKKAWSKIGRSHGHRMSVVSQRPVVELGQGTNTTLVARANGGRPQHTVLSKLHSAFTTLGKEVLHLRIRRAHKEERLIKITLPG